MPLGFGKSVFSTTTAAAGGGGSASWFTQTDSVDTGKARTVYATRSSNFSSSNNVTISYWFRGTSSDIDAGYGSAQVFYIQDGNNTFLHTIRTDGLDFGMFIPGYGGEFMTARPASFSANYLDGNWHHVNAQFRGQAGDTSKNWTYVDGVAVHNNYSGTFPSGCQPGDDLQMNGRFLTNSVNNESSFDLADLYFLWGTATDFSSNRSYWYNSGYVDVGTDGTGGGAPTPDVFLNCDSGSFVEGANGYTVTETGQAGSSFTINTSGGPG